MDPSLEKGRFLSVAAWLLAFSLVGIAFYLGLRAVFLPAGEANEVVASDGQKQAMRASWGQASPNLQAIMPEYFPTETSQAILRRPELHTIIPSRPRQEVITYTVQKGDSVFEIAKKFNLKPETVLWSNYAQLNDNPDLISVGMQLRIPPVDGVLYEFQEGDSLETVAARFEANLDEVLNWPGNRLDLSNPQVEPGTWLIVPGGHREFRQWIIPTIPRGSAGVSSSVYGAGACTGSYDGAYGSGVFVWPAANHILSGNDYWSGHLGIDIAAGDGAPIYAADSGVVVFAGWANGGYGNTVMIDHGNGYQTLYAHMKSAAVRCGQSVSQGGIIGYAGSTGNSTGTHLHFEVRYLGGFVSPWYVLPAP